ncbi:MAG: hypothetical protein II786_08660 [Muribaculaceae bacterium]|nr:hypothetical protein [Muribaculaceae bacterium]
MRIYRMICGVVLLAGVAFAAHADDIYVRSTTNVKELDNDIKVQEQLVSQKQDSIKDIEGQIKKLKDEIKDLEKRKKAFEEEIKYANKTRKATFDARDKLVFEQEVVDVLLNPYNKSDVDEALKSFEGMETKEVLKKKDLVRRYGEYTKDLKEFLEKQKPVLAATGWAYLSSTDELYKKFEKGLKGTDYWKIYNKKEKNPSIDYLDRVMDKVVQFKNSGLNSEMRLNEIINMLYAR